LRTTALRWPAGAAALALSLVFLAGCAIDKGTALAADFEADWADTPDVASIDTDHYNTLPFAGSATGILILEDDTSPERVAELANELSGYVADHDEITGEITADGIAFTVAADEALTADIAALWQSLAEDARVAAGVIDIASANEDRLSVEITAVDAASAMAVFADTTADANPRLAIGSVPTSLEVGTEQEVRPWLAVATGPDGELPADAIAAYEAVAAAYPVAGAGLRVDGASIVLGEGADPGPAAELARSAAPGLDLDVTSDEG
jgi:hypothetical protein